MSEITRRDALQRLASSHRLYLGGRAWAPEVVELVGATLLEGDPVTAAEQIAQPTARGSL